MLEPIMLRSQCPRDTVTWKQGETIASAGELMAFNGITAEALTKHALSWCISLPNCAVNLLAVNVRGCHNP